MRQIQKITIPKPDIFGNFVSRRLNGDWLEIYGFNLNDYGLCNNINKFLTMEELGNELVFWTVTESNWGSKEFLIYMIRQGEPYPKYPLKYIGKIINEGIDYLFFYRL